jgi:radical SAM superfamily enzyme YgiQ (UPF0313 family)
MDRGAEPKMAKIGIEATTDGKNHYTYKWLKYVCERFKIPVYPTEESDLVLCTISSLDDISVLLNMRKSGKLIIMGGAESYYDRLYSMLADIVNVGEGIELMHRLGAIHHLPPTDIIEQLKQEKYTAYYDRTEKIYPSTAIDWEMMPPIYTSIEKKSILASKGCNHRCAFCYTSHTSPYCKNPLLCFFTGDKHIHYITNDSEGNDILTCKNYVRSITMRHYLNTVTAYHKTCRKYRIGLESFSESTRKNIFKKPIDNATIHDAVQTAKIFNHELLLFIIAGIDPQESINEFLNTIGPDSAMKPRLEIKCTYFNACLHTPMQAYDMRKLYHWDRQYLLSLLRSVSPRFRLNIRDSEAYSVWSTLMHRVNAPDELRKILIMKNLDMSGINERLERYGLERLMYTPPDTLIQW